MSAHPRTGGVRAVVVALRPAADMPEGLTLGEVLARGVLSMTPGVRARMSRSGQQPERGGHVLELEALLAASGAAALPGAARARVLDTLVVMCALQRGLLRGGIRRPLGEALRMRERRGGAPGEAVIVRLAGTTGEGLSREIRRAAHLAGPWGVAWGPLVELAVRWDDPHERAALVREMQIDLIGRRIFDRAGTLPAGK